MKNIYSLGFTPKLNLHTNDKFYYSANYVDPTSDTTAFPASIKSLTNVYSLSSCAGELVLAPASSKNKSTSWKRRLFAFAAVLVLGVATGVGIGNWYKAYIASQTIDYSNMLISDYEIDQLSVLNSATGLSFTSIDEYGSYGNIAEILHSQGKTPASLSAVQNVALAEYIATTAYNYSSVGIGLIDTIVKQPFSCIKSFDGEQYIVESISSGSVMGTRLDVGNRAVVNVSDPNTTLLYYMKDGIIPVADENGVFSAEFETTPQKYTLDEFIEINGSPANRLIPYIISDKTVLSKGTTQATLQTFNDKNVYAFTINLDPVTSVLRYYRQMNLTSGYNPKFSNVSITIMLDENWNYVHSEVKENYTIIAMGVPASCVGTQVTDYVFNENTLTEVA